MKKISFGFITLLGLSSVAHAQSSYAGAVVALSNIGFDCANTLSCDHKSKGVKLYLGSTLAPSDQIDFLGVAKLQAIEVGYISFGKAKSNGVTSYYYASASDGTPVAYDRNVSRSVGVQAITLAAVTKLPIDSQFGLSIKLGGAYVTSTIKHNVGAPVNPGALDPNAVDNSVIGSVGGSDGSKSASKLKPYIGLGFEYSPMAALRVIGSFDVARYSVDDTKGSAKMFGLGAELDF